MSQQDGPVEHEDHIETESAQPEIEDGGPVEDPEATVVMPDRQDLSIEDRSALEQVRQDLEQAEARLQESHDRYLRSAAELENLRKRSARDIERASRYGAEKIVGELLPVIDSMELGLDAAREAGVDALLEGAEATLKMLLSALEKCGVSVVDPKGQPFNPEFHEAMTTQESADAEPDTVLIVVQKGYLLHDRLMRPARVIVSRAPQD